MGKDRESSEWDRQWRSSYRFQTARNQARVEIRACSISNQASTTPWQLKRHGRGRAMQTAPVATWTGAAADRDHCHKRPGQTREPQFAPATVAGLGPHERENA